MKLKKKHFTKNFESFVMNQLVNAARLKYSIIKKADNESKLTLII